MLNQYIAWFDRIDNDDEENVSFKASKLGELTKHGFPVPPGFVITSNAYLDFIKFNNLNRKIEKLFSTLNLNHSHSVNQVFSLIRNEITNSKLQPELIKEINEANKKINKLNFKNISIMLFPVKTNFPDNAYTFYELDMQNELTEAIKNCWSCLYSPDMINHSNQKIKENTNGFATILQKIIKPDKFGSMLTLNPYTGQKNIIMISSNSYSNDELNLTKPTYYEIEKASKKILKYPFLNENEQNLSNSEIVMLTNLGIKLEKYQFFPQNIEWAFEENKLYILNNRPITNINNEQMNFKTQL